MSMQTVVQPKVLFNILPDITSIAVDPQRVLYIGQKTSTGTATSGELVQDILNNNDYETFFGINSMLSAMIRAGKKVNEFTSFDAIPLSDDGAAVAATGSYAVTGTATESKTIEVIAGSRTDHSYEISITSGDTATQVGDAIEAAITADTKAPVTASNTTGTVTVTAVNLGTAGNNIGLRIIGTVAGLGFTVNAMSGGATDPSTTGIFDVVGNQRYQTIIFPSEYGYTFLTDFLDPRFNPSIPYVLDGVGISTASGTFAALQSAGNAENSQSLTIFGNKTKTATQFKGSAMLELNYVISSYFGAVRALRRTDGVSIADYVTATVGELDTFASKEISSLPYHNTPYKFLPLIDIGDGFDFTEADNLADAGISLLGNNKANNSIIANKIVTTRKTDSAGNPETTFKFLNAVDTSSVVREYFHDNCSNKYSQSRLSDGDAVPGRAVATKNNIETYLDQLFGELQGVLTVGGEEALRFFKLNRSVTLDVAQGLVTVTMKVPIVGQVREIRGAMRFTFSVNN